MTYRARTCKHCDKPAEWRWTDADGNESSNICQQCMDDVTFYQDKPLWHFDLLQSLVADAENNGTLLVDDSGFIDLGRLPVLPLAIALVAGYAIHFMAIHGIFASLSILAR